MNKIISKIEKKCLDNNEIHEIMYDAYSESRILPLIFQKIDDEEMDDYDWEQYLDDFLEKAYILYKLKLNGFKIKRVNIKYISTINIDNGEEINVPIIESLRF